ncbi:MAG: hypothetical protein Q4C00_03300 [Bacillota bacterium]|nr:hypothetical protein [Bacillota bacterium]
MSQKLKIRVFLGVSIICWAIIACWAMYTHQQGSAVDPIYDTIHGDIYSTVDTFAVYDAAPTREFDNISGVVAADPQNDAASAAETMSLLAEYVDGGTVAVIAFGNTNGVEACGGDWGWQGSYGVIQTDKEAVAALEESGLFRDNKVLNDTVSLGMIMDYFSYYLPGVSVVPFVLDEGASVAEIKETLAQYKNILSSYPVVVVTPTASGEVPLNNDFSPVTVTVGSLNTMDLSGQFNREAILALTAFGQLLPPEAAVHIFPHTEYKNDEAQEVGEYFSDLQIICEK